MARRILLDAGVIGLLVSPPRLPNVVKGRAWLEAVIAQSVVTLPDVAVYEVRRELLRIRAAAKLDHLANLCGFLGRTEVTLDAWGKAGEFWALVRRAGIPTAHPEALDADAILGGVAATLGQPGDEVVIATTNPGHLVRFPGVVAQDWQEIR